MHTIPSPSSSKNAAIFFSPHDVCCDAQDSIINRVSFFDPEHFFHDWNAVPLLAAYQAIWKSLIPRFQDSSLTLDRAAPTKGCAMCEICKNKSLVKRF
jgi:hypothetical protein